MTTYYAFLIFPFKEPFMPYCTAIKQGFVTNVEVIFHIILLAQIVGRVIFQYLFNLNEVCRCSLKRYKLYTLILEAPGKTNHMFIVKSIFFGAKPKVYENIETICKFTNWISSYPYYVFSILIEIWRRT